MYAAPPVGDAALAVAKHVETLLPPLDEITDGLAIAEGRTGALGPEVTLPAVYVRIITAAFRGEVLGRQADAMQAKITRAERKPASPLSDEEGLALAVHLANEAVALSHESIEAVAALWKASATIAVAHLPAFTALRALDEIHAAMRADIAQAIGSGATKQ